MSKKTLYLDSMEIKSTEQSKGLSISGYANTVSRDRTGDVIVPSAWTKGAQEYLKNPVLLLQHKHDQPIGKVTKMRLDNKGIHVEADISEAAEKQYGTRTLVRDGALKAFSVGFRPKRARYDRKTDTTYITELELLEISIVSVPCNQDSLFSVRKSFDNNEDYKSFLEEVVDKNEDTTVVKAGISEIHKDGHYHTFEVDADGNGTATYTSHGQKHNHDVVNYEIKSAEDGHSHDVQIWKDSSKLPEMEIESNFNNIEELLTDEENKNMPNSENKASETEVKDMNQAEETVKLEIPTEGKTNDSESTKADVEDKNENSAVEQPNTKTDTSVPTDSNIKETVDEETQADPYKAIPFVNLLSMSTGELKADDFVKLDGSRHKIKNIATQTNPNFIVEPVSVEGEVIGEAVSIKATDLSVINTWDIGTKFDIKMVKHAKVTNLTDKQREEIKKGFVEHVNLKEIDLNNLKSSATTQEQQITLNNTYNLIATNFKDWNDTNYALANRVVEKIKALKGLPESDDRNLQLILNGHKAESQEEKKDMPTQNVDEPMVVNTGAKAENAPNSVAQVKEPQVQDLLNKTEQTMNKAADNEEIRGDTSLSDQVEELMQEIKKQKELVNALQNSKMVYNQNNDPSRKAQFTDKEMANAVFLAKALGKNNEQVFDTNFGSKMKAITTVDQFLSNFSSTVYEEMQQQLVIVPMFRRIQVDAKSFDVPVTNEDVDGDVAQFANGTFATGAYDATRVPTSNQNTISSVRFTPHKWMATTHLAKDEQEDTVLPLIDFLRADAARRVARAIDKSLLRGDGTLTGFNASPTNAITPGAGYASVMKGLVTLANDVAGLRVNCGASTAATPANIAAARAKLGKYGLQLGDDLVYLTTIEGYNELVQTSDFRTVDKYGPNATYLTGSIGAVYGMPVMITEFLDAAGANDDHIGLLLYKPGFMIAERRAMEIESEYNPRQQVTAVYMSTRFDMKPLTTVGTSTAPTLSSQYSLASVLRSA